MSAKPQSTRRSFLKGGAVAAAPLAAGGAAAALAETAHGERLARLEDEAAIRDLHRTWLHKLNSGAHAEAVALFADARRAGLEGVSRIVPDHEAEPERIALAADRQSASGRYACVVETQAELRKDCTLAMMAHAQGQGTIRRSERRQLTAEYVRTGAGWAIASLRLDPA